MTEFDKVYRLFLSKVKDFTFVSYTDEELKDSLNDYLILAVGEFSSCKKDLEELTGNGDAFNAYLDNTELDILTDYMIVSYLKPKIINVNLLERELTDREFRAYSQANHIKEMISLYKTMVSDVEAKKSRYAFKNWGSKND